MVQPHVKSRNTQIYRAIGLVQSWLLSHQPLHIRDKLTNPKRLGHHIIYIPHTSLNLLLPRISRDRSDRYISYWQLTQLQLPDTSYSGKTFYDWHLKIHEDRVEVEALTGIGFSENTFEGLEGFLAAIGDFDDAASF